MESMEPGRSFLKSDRWNEWLSKETDQRKQIPPPPVQKAPPEGAPTFDLVPSDKFTVGQMPLVEAIRKRKSRRVFTEEAFTLEELLYLLWATQGVREILAEGKSTRRNVPSGGSRHPFETYLAVHRVQGLEPGLYRYLPLDHKLCLLRNDPELPQKIIDAAFGSPFCGKCAVTFIWTVIPYRTEWRYTITSPKIIAIDAGHVCQNLYLAAESIGGGACAVGAYDQAKMDLVIGVDGTEEFVIYMAPTGKVKG
jgi:SagB-type dehydrogenase family enzyme